MRLDCHLHTKADKHFKCSETGHSYITSYVDSLENNGVTIGCITNHNHFDFDEFKYLRKEANRRNIVLLPGVEFAVNEGSNHFHALIVFKPEEWLANGQNYIQPAIAAGFTSDVLRETSPVKSMWDLQNVFQQFATRGGERDFFVILAHVDDDSGFFKECGGGRITELAKIPDFWTRVLGLQKSYSKINYDNFVNNWAKREIARLEGSDPKSINEVGLGTGRNNRRTYVKVGDLTFDAVKSALVDYENRVKNTVNEDWEKINRRKRAYIQSVEFKSNRIKDHANLHFNSDLNCIFGIRGSGKSTIIESIRYALSLENLQQDKEYKKSLPHYFLGSGGSITLHVQDDSGRPYRIERISDGDQRVLIYDPNNTAIPSSNLSAFTDGVLYFGQKDLSMTDPGNERDLLEKLIGKDVSHKRREIELTNREIVDGIRDHNSLLSQERKLAVLELEEGKHRDYLLEYEEMQIEKELGDETSFRDDKNYIQNLIKELDSFSEAYESFISHDFRISLPSFGNYQSRLNQDTIASINEQLDTLNGQLKSLDSFKSIIDEIIKNIRGIEEKFDGQHDKQRERFADIRRELSDKFGFEVNEYLKIREKHEDIKKEVDSLDNISCLLKKKKFDLAQSFKDRDKQIEEVHRLYEKQISDINEPKSPLTVSIQRRADKNVFFQRLKDNLKGCGMQEPRLRRLSEKFTDFAEMIEDYLINDGEELKKIVKPETTYGKFADTIENNYCDLISIETPDKVEILYHGKPLKDHSAGQRASALLIFLLNLQRHSVIIIDQPEDEMDSVVIYDEIIPLIKKQKLKTQFIFTSHSANIPVLGEAEKMIQTHFSGGMFSVFEGNLDKIDTREQIVKIMEGGREAFQKRHQTYGRWSDS